MSARGAEFAHKQTLDRFTHQGRRDGVDVASAHGRAATFITARDDHIDHEVLIRTSCFVGGSQPAFTPRRISSAMTKRPVWPVAPKTATTDLVVLTLSMFLVPMLDATDLSVCLVQTGL